MGFVTILWSAAAGVSAALAIVSGSVGLTARRNSSSLALFILGLAVAVSACLELYMMHSATAAEYGGWLRWYHVPVFVALITQALFVRFYLGTGRWSLFWVVVAARVVVLIVDFVVRPNFNFVSIELGHVSFLGETVSITGASIPRTGWQIFALASTFLLTAYSVDASVTRWRLGGLDAKRKAVAIGLGITAPWICTIIYNQLIVFGVLHVPVTSLFWFLGALFVMMFELTRDYVLSRLALVQLAELQRQLMHRERVSVLDQLATGLAHQLAQPLHASGLNAIMALRLLDNEDLDREELRAILIDIDSDIRRGGELIDRVRKLIKNHAIELRPLKMEDVVQDAISLIRSEAIAKRVALLVQPDLPTVMGDRVHLSQVMLNLLMNAIQAVQTCPADTRRVMIEARKDDGKGQVEVTVRDSGPGIPEGIADKVFGPFFTTKPEGMGMGLALSRTIIEAHGGLLWMERATTRPPDGAVFHFTLQQT